MNDGREPLSVSTLEVAGRIRKEISANRAEVQIPDFTLADVVVGLVLIAVKLFLPRHPTETQSSNIFRSIERPHVYNGD